MLADVGLTKYPVVHVEEIDDWPETVEGIEMEFRLTYRGRLPSVGRSDTRVGDKHRIRKEIHKQLRYLWDSNAMLTGMLRNEKYIKQVTDRYARCGFRFLPLIGNTPGQGLACALDILFLRRDQPGNLVTHRGDIDNRLKVLFDALQVPDDCSQLPKDAKPDVDEDPMFCLLYNDKLITELKVTTDQLLTLPLPGESINDVELVISVRTIHAPGDELMLVG